MTKSLTVLHNPQKESEYGETLYDQHRPHNASDDQFR